jgi:hypothetical protein
MARKPRPEKKPIEQYAHPDKKRVNNPPVGLVTAETDRDSGRLVGLKFTGTLCAAEKSLASAPSADAGLA